MIFWIRKPVSINGLNFYERQQKKRRLRVEHILFCLFSKIQLTSVIWEDKAWRTHLKKCKRSRLLKEQEELLIQTLPHIQQGKLFELGMKETRVQQSGMDFFSFFGNFWSSLHASKVITSSSLKSTTTACARYLYSLVRVYYNCWGSIL